MLGTLAGDTLQTGPGRAYRDGTLGCVGCGAVLQEGPGFAYREGSLGGQLLTGPGRVVGDGSLGQPPVRQVGLRPEQRAAMAAARAARAAAARAQQQRLLRHLNRYRRGGLRGLGLVDLSPDLLIGAALGIAGVYFAMKPR